MTNRTFGVEIECGIGARGTYSFTSLARRLRDAGMEQWSIGSDGTEFEVRTPILQGQKGLNTLKKGMRLLLDLGGYVTVRDGLHVHHGASEFLHDLGAIQRLVKAWHQNQPVIEGMVRPNRRAGGSRHGSCPHWTAGDMVRIDSGHGPSDFDRRSLNITSLPEHGTIEIRLHEGTLDFDAAKAWVLFGQKFIEAVLADHKPDKRAESTATLLKEIRLGHRNGAYLREKARLNGAYPDPGSSPTLYGGQTNE